MHLRNLILHYTVTWVDRVRGYIKLAPPLFFLQSIAFFYMTKFNSLPNDKILDWSNLKAFADDKINVTENLKFVLGRTENIMGKGENAGYQHFLLFP